MADEVQFKLVFADSGAIAQRDAEIQKLERLVWDAVYALQKAGLDSEAARLRRAIERH